MYQSRLSLPSGSSRNLLNTRDSACFVQNYFVLKINIPTQKQVISYKLFLYVGTTEQLLFSGFCHSHSKFASFSRLTQKFGWANTSFKGTFLTFNTHKVFSIRKGFKFLPNFDSRLLETLSKTSRQVLPQLKKVPLLCIPTTSTV